MPMSQPSLPCIPPPPLLPQAPSPGHPPARSPQRRRRTCTGRGGAARRTCRHGRGQGVPLIGSHRRDFPQHARGSKTILPRSSPSCGRQGSHGTMISASAPRHITGRSRPLSLNCGRGWGGGAGACETQLGELGQHRLGGVSCLRQQRIATQATAALAACLCRRGHSSTSPNSTCQKQRQQRQKQQRRRP